MKVELANIPVSLDAMLPENLTMLEAEVSRACGFPLRAASEGTEPGSGEFRLARRSVDARKKSNVHFVVSVVADVPSVDALSPAKGVTVKEHVPPPPLDIPDLSRARDAEGFASPIVVGAGPAGLFCALYLAASGLAPLVVERGKPVEKRMADVEAFFADGALDPDSNVQFGEGGAGTFSDGKLNTGTKSPHIRHVLEAFVEAGAPADLLVDAKPHIGTDLLPGVVRNIRKRIEREGGRFAFCTRLVSVQATAYEGGGAHADGPECGASTPVAPGLPCITARFEDVHTGESFQLRTHALVLAIGHSARDTFQALRDAGLHMERKPFAVGVRIEHLQSDIDAAQYGRAAGHPALGPADYKLAVHNPDGRGVYTFCMCPGGTVVAAASERGGVCVNGMSDSARSGTNANSALLASVEPSDLPGADVFEGVRLQQRMEAAAFDLGRGAACADYCAPAQTVGGFMAGKAGSESTKVAPSYPRGVAWADLGKCLPDFVADSIREALPALGRKLKGFDDPGAVLTGVEARSSSPVRMVRDRACMQSISMPGVYPAGEGAGYAGGITSAAVDGLRVAEAVCVEYSALLRGGAA